MYTLAVFSGRELGINKSMFAVIVRTKYKDTVLGWYKTNRIAVNRAKKFRKMLNNA